MSITLDTMVYTFDGHMAGNISQYSNRAAGVAAGFSPLTAKVDGANQKGEIKIRWKLKIPVVATEDSECSCSGTLLRESFTDIVVTIAGGASLAERTHMAEALEDLTASTEFRASVINLLQPNA